MKLAEYQFREEEILLLKDYRDHHPDGRLQQRFLALLMIAEGDQVEFVQSVLSISERTLERWFANYYARGIDSLNSFQYQPKQTYLGDPTILLISMLSLIYKNQTPILI